VPDLYASLVRSPVGNRLSDLLGLPKPAVLRRYEPGQPLVDGPVLLAGGGRLLDPATKVLHEAGAHLTDTPSEEGCYGAVLLDMTGSTTSEGLRVLHDVLHPAVRRIRPSGRVVLLGTPPEAATSTRERAAQRALEGFVRSLGKELRGGSTAHLLAVAPGGEAGIASPLRFLLSARSAYVDAQVLTVAPTGGPDPYEPADWGRPLDGRVALVTGAARGIGEAIAEVLARDGAHAVCLDVPAQGERLAAVANRVGGSSLQVDITAPDAPQRIAAHLRRRHGGVDVVVHNAGITRDRTLAGMAADRWDLVLDINLSAQERIDDALLGTADEPAPVLNEGGRIVAISSLSGIAGNRGQTSYAASKAGVIGRIHGLAAELDGDRTANAVAPGFIETEMTGAMPFAVREAGRRMSSLGQGGLPVDVAEAVAFFASPASGWVNGQVLRVCGQSLLGA
jgi:3-oxoacyl-[acyl-carrier protein] reductase